MKLDYPLKADNSDSDSELQIKLSVNVRIITNQDYKTDQMQVASVCLLVVQDTKALLVFVLLVLLDRTKITLALFAHFVQKQKTTEQRLLQELTLHHYALESSSASGRAGARGLPHKTKSNDQSKTFRKSHLSIYLISKLFFPIRLLCPKRHKTDIIL